MSVESARGTDAGVALRAALISPNESDGNGEAANVVDGLFAVARAIEHLASATRSISHGDVHGATGLEMLSMAINGDGTLANGPLASVVLEGFQEVANAIRESSAGLRAG